MCKYHVPVALTFGTEIFFSSGVQHDGTFHRTSSAASALVSSSREMSRGNGTSKHTLDALERHEGKFHRASSAASTAAPSAREISRGSAHMVAKHTLGALGKYSLESVEAVSYVPSGHKADPRRAKSHPYSVSPNGRKTGLYSMCVCV